MQPGAGGGTGRVGGGRARGAELVEEGGCGAAGGPVGGDDVGQLGALAAGVGEVHPGCGAGEDVDEGVGAALAGAAGVVQALSAGEWFEDGEDGFGVLGGEDEPAGDGAVGRGAQLQVPLGVRGPGLIVEGGFAVGGDPVRDQLAKRLGVQGTGDGDQVLLAVAQVRERELAVHPQQHRSLLLGQRAVGDGLPDQWQVAQGVGAAQVATGLLPGAHGRVAPPVLGRLVERHAVAAGVGEDAALVAAVQLAERLVGAAEQPLREPAGEESVLLQPGLVQHGQVGSAQRLDRRDRIPMDARDSTEGV